MQLRLAGVIGTILATTLVAHADPPAPAPGAAGPPTSAPPTSAPPTSAPPTSAAPSGSAAPTGSAAPPTTAPSASSPQAPPAGSAPAAAPVAPSPPAAQPPAAQPPTAQPAAAAQPPAPAQYVAPTQARVELKVNYPDAWLELRSVTYGGPWRRACQAPCGKTLEVDGTEARVQAPGMTTTNVFRLQPGVGTARLSVDGGSKSWRDWGVLSLAIGTPVALGGGALYGFGHYQDSQGLKGAGIAALAVGGLAVVASLPMLISGSTSVRDFNGKLIAQSRKSRFGAWQF